MHSKNKLKILGEEAKFDACGYPSKRSLRFSFIYPAVGEGGKCVRLFKVLQSNICENNCLYCANRRDRNFYRNTFEPNELARLFMEYYLDNQVDGCFLSSGIVGSPDKSQERMLQTLKILRQKYGYKEYIHTKILPGVSDELVDEIAKYSDRLSINLEAPGQDYLSKLSGDKNFARLISRLKKISEINRTKSLKAGITTQLVVGAASENDRTIMNVAHRLYKNYGVWRVYYSGFVPLRDTPLENLPFCPPRREVMLYQADMLIRKYKFAPQELPFDGVGNLPKDIDPKLAWAKMHKELFPLEISKASFYELIRVPGIGRVSANRILGTRKITKIKDLEQLKKLGAVVRRAQNYITLDGRFFPRKEQEYKKYEEEQLFL
jgi:predicted DNA-binding helix-hairpin-helix protein